MTNREIAARLCVSTRTVETHVEHILRKLDLSTRTQLVARAHEGGLLPRK
jgi:non-specific serine/threonine protein kinase